jgi:hypothetical protein
MYALEHNAVPVYDLLKDIHIIKEKTLAYYKAKYPRVKTYNTNAKEVTFTRIGDYVRVGVDTYYDKYTANIPVDVLKTILY